MQRIFWQLKMWFAINFFAHPPSPLHVTLLMTVGRAHNGCHVPWTALTIYPLSNIKFFQGSYIIVTEFNISTSWLIGDMDTENGINQGFCWKDGLRTIIVPPFISLPWPTPLTTIFSTTIEPPTLALYWGGVTRLPTFPAFLHGTKLPYLLPKISFWSR